jgi:hypothetical protein
MVGGDHPLSADPDAPYCTGYILSIPRGQRPDIPIRMNTWIQVSISSLEKLILIHGHLMYIKANPAY